MNQRLILAVGCAVMAGCGLLPCQREAAQNREAVVSFYQEALIARNVRAGFERYMSADFIEHKADVPNGDREATIAFSKGS